ncbi:hypothetical protein CPC08DRAFT_259967 [Agrocybe pediades]|nr:hypothetical protein CPC08DRAFT_259967 [Agrocybe pediades]
MCSTHSLNTTTRTERFYLGRAQSKPITNFKPSILQSSHELGTSSKRFAFMIKTWLLIYAASCELVRIHLHCPAIGRVGIRASIVCSPLRSLLVQCPQSHVFNNSFFRSLHRSSRLLVISYVKYLKTSKEVKPTELPACVHHQLRPPSNDLQLGSLVHRPSQVKGNRRLQAMPTRRCGLLCLSTRRRTEDVSGKLRWTVWSWLCYADS